MCTTTTAADEPTTKAKDGTAASGMKLAILTRVLFVGTFFGIVLVKSEVVRWQRPTPLPRAPTYRCVPAPASSPGA